MLELTYRANRAYRIVLPDDLSNSEVELLNRDSPHDAFAFLCPVGREALPIKAIDKSTAVLFYTLQTPTRLPGFFRAEAGSRAASIARDLVLGGVLEVEVSRTFVSGAAAFLAFQEVPPMHEARFTDVSRDAIHYGFQLRLRNPIDLWPRLYFYGRYPFTPEWQSSYLSISNVLRFLDLDAGNDESISDIWAMTMPSLPQNPWIGFTPRSLPPTLTDTMYKLYVSPSPRELPIALAAVRQLLASEHSHLFFKCAGEAQHFLRPDKLVIYTDTLDDLVLLAEALALRLEGCQSHPVPFTAPVKDEGLLSWGIDPPRGARHDAERTSWRVWICKELALSLIQARDDGLETPEDAYSFSVDRLTSRGVDPRTWAPRNSIFVGS
jgi:hypothetical protein